MDNLSERDAGRIEGYAKALDDILSRLTGDSFSAKHYDPATVNEGMIYSYAFDLKDGGIRHPLSEYSSVDEIQELMLEETVAAIRG